MDFLKAYWVRHIRDTSRFVLYVMPLVWLWYAAARTRSGLALQFRSALFLSGLIWFLTVALRTPYYRVVTEEAWKSVHQRDCKPYRFGTAFAVPLVSYGVIVCWRASQNLLWWDAVQWALSGLIAVGAGLGLLRKRVYGLGLLDFAIIVIIADIVFGSWRNPLADLVVVGTCVPVWVYYWKRRSEFLAQEWSGRRLYRDFFINPRRGPTL